MAIWGCAVMTWINDGRGFVAFDLRDLAFFEQEGGTGPPIKT